LRWSRTGACSGLCRRRPEPPAGRDRRLHLEADYSKMDRGRLGAGVDLPRPLRNRPSFPISGLGGAERVS
jgi:hypothetical protein